ncbi:hypothetical protein IP90_03272 [Luteimonas cucumeris]|uniref:Secreted protein n=1 Tax=Luteimonas cucumeris TaxID=985012 RepID=A0A562KU44_9GAMM|nr:hypothetical protein [Luteimonas cucumeris]TWH98887.1 hypothetical protein IP90_03272 [Luteimonas cucumeris]
MKTATVSLSLALAISGLTLPSPVHAADAITDAIPADNAPRFTGRSGTVCGKVERARYAEKTEGEPTFLYMGGQFPRHKFTVRIQGADRAKFNPAPESLEGKDVCAIGQIEPDSSRAEIVVTSPSNLKIASMR